MCSLRTLCHLFRLLAIPLAVLLVFSLRAEGKALPTVQLTDAEQEWLKAHPVITLAPDPDFKPIEYFDKNGNYQGAAADIIRILEKKLGITITIARLKNWDEAIAKFKNHEVDLLGAMVRTPNREKFALFTETLVAVPGGIFTRSGSPTNLTLKDLKGKKVAVVSSYAAHDVLKEQYPHLILDVVPDVSTGLAKASLGMVDAYVENMANATFYSQEAGITNLRLAGKTGFEYRWGIGIRKDWPELQGILNKGLAAISEKERQQAIQRWIFIDGDRWQPSKAFILGAVGSSLAVLLLLVVYWNYALRRLVRSRTSSLQQELEERQKVEASLQNLTGQLEERVRERTIELQKEIVERIKIEDQLKASEEYYRCFTGLTSDYVHKCSRTGTAPFRIQWMGGAVDAISGYSPEEVFKLGCWLPLVHPDDKQTVVSYLFSLAPGSSKQIEFRLVTKGGETRWVSEKSHCEAGESEGELIMFGAVNDITERKRAEEERKKMEQQLLNTQKLESLGVLAGGIAHDFNNILTSIVGNADLALMKTSRESPVAENLHRIEQGAARAADLAKQMLAYSGRGKFLVENLDMNCLLEEMLHMLEVSISKKAVLKLNLTRHLPSIEADGTQMRQIIMNLVINASEAIGEKSGVIAITTGCMDCDNKYLKDVWLADNIRDGLYVYLEIADTGCGMDSETMGKIFDPFFTTKFTGRGLGMAAVLGIVRGHKGAIKVYSEPNKGTSFKVLLPASDRPIEIFNDEAEKDDWKGEGTVLLVDDEETVRGIGTEMLMELGFQVVTAENGSHALEIFSDRGDFSFVILDLTMPHLDGEQTFRELRRIRPDIKVIISSGYNEQDVTQKFVGKGLSGFIQKPYKLSMIRDVIRKLSL